MAASLTLKQIIARVEGIALAHRQINHFFIGDFDKFLSSGEVIYPAIFCELLPNGTISKNERYTTYNFRFYFLDLLNISTDAEENEFELRSDLSSIAQDFMALLNFTDYQDDWAISTSNNFEFKKYELQDLAVGLSVDVAIATPYDSNRCQVPQTGLPEPPVDTGEPTLSLPIVRSYVYVGLGSEGTSATFGTLANKTILMVLKGLQLLVPTTNTPTVNEFKYTALTGSFEFGNDIEENQVIQILYR